jgi:hypothetical protein
VRVTLADGQAAAGEAIDAFIDRVVPEAHQHAVAVLLADALDVVAATARPARPGENVLRGEAAREFVRWSFAEDAARRRREPGL